MFHDFINLLYPQICTTCENVLLKNEKVICTSCLHELPVTNFKADRENPVSKIFYGRITIENATSLLLFEKKGMVQQLIHNLKYRGQEEIGTFLGSWLGRDLQLFEAYQKITAVVPVPLHKLKLKKRGFNQVAKFGQEIAAALHVPYIDTVLVKKSASQTQTLKNRFARSGNIQETFVVENTHQLEHAHILLVDDLVTTGATLEACATKLADIAGIKISIATMAVTH